MVSPAINVMFGSFNLGGGEIILILALVLILFGAKKLPELAGGLGEGINRFWQAVGAEACSILLGAVVASMQTASANDCCRRGEGNSSPRLRDCVGQRLTPQSGK